jgi:hypothetical protein
MLIGKPFCLFTPASIDYGPENPLLALGRELQRAHKAHNSTGHE